MFKKTCHADSMLLQQGGDWRLVRCMCGALSGRCQDHVTDSGEVTAVYRLVKYAIRPVSPSAEYVLHVHSLLAPLTDRCVRPRPCRIPLSAFIVEDMVELARAHATYRFVVLDEEEERPRILVRLSRLFSACSPASLIPSPKNNRCGFSNRTCVCLTRLAKTTSSLSVVRS